MPKYPECESSANAQEHSRVSETVIVDHSRLELIYSLGNLWRMMKCPQKLDIREVLIGGHIATIAPANMFWQRILDNRCCMYGDGSFLCVCC